MRDEPFWLSLAEASRRIRARELSPVELTRSVLERIERLDPALHAFVSVTAERALAAAARAEAELVRGAWRGPLHGVPVSVKDLFHARGARTTAGSRFLADAISELDAAVVERLEGAGAVLVGKSNLHEFAYGTTSASSIAGPVRNPWDPARIPGGSSGGSAAAVAAGLGFASIGTDTGGSVRIPAALCGVVGLKPSFGRVSRYGLIPLSPTLDHVGPLARTVEDAALVLQAIAGHDPRDPASAREPVPDFGAGLGAGLRGLRIGVLEETLDAVPGAEIAAGLRAALSVLRAEGAEVRPERFAALEAAREAAFVILFAESAATHRTRWTERPGDFFPDVLARFERGRALLAIDLLRALSLRSEAEAEARARFERVDLLAAAMVPIEASPIGADAVRVDGRDVEVVPQLTANTREWNLLGNPALSLPCGFTAAGLPFALQLVGRRLDEATLLRAGAAYQRATDWHLRHPA